MPNDEQHPESRPTALNSPTVDTVDPALVARLAEAARLLEEIADNRALLAAVPEEDRNKFLLLAGQVSRPDAILRRQLLKETKRRLKATKVQRIEAAFSKTGIRKLRQEVVFTSPNVFPPEHFEQHEVVNNEEFREAVQRMNCYVCKKDYLQLHHFYDQLCPECAELNFMKRTETADLRGKVALLTGGSREDWLSGRSQAASCRRTSHRHHALPARLGRTVRGRAGFRGMVRSSGDLWSRPASHAQRRSVLS
jgi:hypothetical protein